MSNDSKNSDGKSSTDPDKMNDPKIGKGGGSRDTNPDGKGGGGKK